MGCRMGVSPTVPGVGRTEPPREIGIEVLFSKEWAKLGVTTDTLKTMVGNYEPSQVC